MQRAGSATTAREDSPVSAPRCTLALPVVLTGRWPWGPRVVGGLSIYKPHSGTGPVSGQVIKATLDGQTVMTLQRPDLKYWGIFRPPEQQV